MNISSSGIFYDFDTGAYYRDPCPIPSLTQSIAKIILDRSPRHARERHPRLNPDFQEDNDRKFDVGNIAHALMIGRGKDILIIEADDWRSKAAREQREVAASQNKLGVLAKHYALAERMVKAARSQLERRGLEYLFSDGNGEVVLAWQEGDVWLRQMCDWLTSDLLTFVDYKTTDMAAAPHALGRMMVNAGWPIQAAMAERGLDVLDPDNVGRRQFLFVVQETEPPHLLNVVRISEGALTLGRKQVIMARNIWAQCMRNDVWPGYPDQILTPEYPPYYEQQVLLREMEQFSNHSDYAPVAVHADTLMAG